MNKNGFVDYVVDTLSAFGEIKSKSMFGGHGIYKDGVIVGLIIEDELFFKVDESNKQDYIDHNSSPFSYDRGDKVISMSYWRVPLDILEDSDPLGIWVEKSFEASQKVKRKK